MKSDLRRSRRLFNPPHPPYRAPLIFISITLITFIGLYFAWNFRHFYLTENNMQLPFQTNHEKWKKAHYEGLSIHDKVLKNIEAKNTGFIDFTFEDVVIRDSFFENVDFTRSTFSDVTFENVIFKRTPKSEFEVDRPLDEQTDLSSVRFFQVKFKNCRFEKTAMRSSILEHVRFEDSFLDGVVIETLGGEVILKNSRGTDFQFEVIGTNEATYRQEGGKFGKIISRFNGPSFALHQVTSDYFEISGTPKQLTFTKSDIDRVDLGITTDTILLENLHFGFLMLDGLKTKMTAIIRCRLDEGMLLFDAHPGELILMDSDIPEMYFYEGSQMEILSVTRTPIKKFNMTHGAIQLLHFNHMPLPKDWTITPPSKIEKLSLKKVDDLGNFQYRSESVAEFEIQN